LAISVTIVKMAIVNSRPIGHPVLESILRSRLTAPEAHS
jgi:hypothetical protein